jgi:hypothetical protein
MLNAWFVWDKAWQGETVLAHARSQGRAAGRTVRGSRMTAPLTTLVFLLSILALLQAWENLQLAS